MEESKREDIEADEPFPELAEILRDVITEKLSSPEEEESPEEEVCAESIPYPASDDSGQDNAQVMSTTDVESGDIATNGGGQESAETTDSEVHHPDPELDEIREILLGGDPRGRDGAHLSALRRLITSEQEELRDAIDKQTEVLRAHSRDTRAVLEELLTHVRAIATALKALETDPPE